MNKIAIIGSGAMGTALAKVLYDANNKDLIIYGIDENELKDLSNGKNTKYFKDNSKIPNFKTTNDLVVALEGVTHVVMAVPSVVIDKVFEKVLNNLKTKVVVVNGAKGFYPGTQLSLHKGLEEASKDNQYVQNIVSIIGPSHAEEMIIETPTAVCAVESNAEVARKVQKIFTNDYIRVYVQTDVIGAEVGAAYKNVLAIASGLAEGKGYGINTTAALLTRGLKEMVTFCKFMGGNIETIFGLTGIGDLIVTATSKLSRNFSFGMKLAQNKDSKEELKNNTVEGVHALKFIYEIAKENNLKLPIMNGLYEIIYGDITINELMKTLWNRTLIHE